MKYESIVNEQKDVLGIRILESDVADTDPDEIAKLLAEFGLVVFKKVITPLEVYHSWQLSLGYHQLGDIWCNDREFPIFYLVTHRQLTEFDEGLFGHGELDWHCNILFTPDGEEIVGLYGKQCQKGADTIISNSIPLWKNLSPEKQSLYSSLKLKITNLIDQTYEKKAAHYSLPTDNLKDFDRKRSKLDITKAINFEAKNANLYLPPRFTKQHLVRLTPSHPRGTRGLYFPHLNLVCLADGDGNPIENHQAEYQEIKRNYVDSGRYLYRHTWETGDIVLMDQLTTIHKREPIDPSVPRELLRTACWYKTNLRQHFKRSI